jgi:hypothetical protein
MNENQQQHLSAKLKGFELWTHYCFPAFCALPCFLFLALNKAGFPNFKFLLVENKPAAAENCDGGRISKIEGG